MHYTAEYGIAAHWKYKAGIEKKDKLEERLAFVRQLLEVQQDSGDAQDIVRSIKSDIAPEECFVFTPKGDVINLPTGRHRHRLCLRHSLRGRQPHDRRQGGRQDRAAGL